MTTDSVRSARGDERQQSLQSGISVGLPANSVNCGTLAIGGDSTKTFIAQGHAEDPDGGSL